MFNTLFFISISPFVLFIFLLLWKKLPLLWVSFLTFCLVLVLTAFLWQIYPKFIYISLVKGFLVAFDIFIIIFGAVFFLELLKSLKIIDDLCLYLESFSKDYRVKIIVLAWFLENFLEGTAGFGTASIIVVPILISLGLSPINAVIISLLGNSTSVAFGAAGTPIRVGFAGINVSSVPVYTAAINGIGFLVPVFMLWTLVASQKEKTKQFFEGLPFAVWAGLAFVVPSFLTVFLGQEFPSILGAVIGLALVLITTKLKLFVPKNIQSIRPTSDQKIKSSLLKVVFPYILLIFLLIAGKFLIGSAGINFSYFKHTFNFFNPGWAFIIAGLPVIAFWVKPRKNALQFVKTAFKRTMEPFLVIVLMSAIVQLMINSGQNISDIPSLLNLIAKSFENPSLPFWSPFIGAFGSFITGSATISNIMFGNLLNTACEVLKIDAGKVLSLSLVGASAGNMIALADMMAAEAVAGLHNKERQVLKGVIIPCLIYVILAGLIGLLIFL